MLQENYMLGFFKFLLFAIFQDPLAERKLGLFIYSKLENKEVFS